MNIDPLNNSGYVNRSQINARGQKGQNSPVSPEDNDRLSAQLSSKVRATLAEMPEVRPEVVARGRELLADPSYPSAEIVRKIASLITPLPEE
jgi:hypothetical protein